MKLMNRWNGNFRDETVCFHRRQMPVPTAWRSDGCVCNHAVSKPTKTMLYDREGVSFPVQIALLHPTDDEPFICVYYGHERSTYGGAC